MVKTETSRSTCCPDDLHLIAIQYAKAKNLKVIGIDISESQLQNANDLGADLTFNSMTDPEYVQKLKKTTKGGAHAAIVFSAAQGAYKGAPRVLRYVLLCSWSLRIQSPCGYIIVHS